MIKESYNMKCGETRLHLIWWMNTAPISSILDISLFTFEKNTEALLLNELYSFTVYIYT